MCSSDLFVGEACQAYMSSAFHFPAFAGCGDVLSARIAAVHLAAVDMSGADVMSGPVSIIVSLYGVLAKIASHVCCIRIG